MAEETMRRVSFDHDHHHHHAGCGCSSCHASPDDDDYSTGRHPKLHGVDLKSYQRPELVNKISEMSSFITYALSSLATPPFLMLLVIVALCLVLSFDSTTTTTTTNTTITVDNTQKIIQQQKSFFTAGRIIFFIAGAISSLVLGGCLGIMQFIKRFVQDLVVITEMSLDVARQINEDINQFRTDPDSVPNASDLIEAVSYQVIIPIVHRIAENKLGFLYRFATPVISAVEIVIKMATSTLVSVVNKFSYNNNNNKSTSTSLADNKKQVAEKKNYVDIAINNVKKYVKLNEITAMIHSKLLNPLRILFWVFFALDTLALAGVYFAFSK